MSHSMTERAELAETFRETGPDAPTRCEGWRSRHLLAHLVLRERRPWAVGADLLSRARPGQEPRLGRLADQAADPAGFASLVDVLADGPPAWNPMGLLGDRANLLEMVVHHEDLRRGDLAEAEPRVLPTERVRAVWEHLQPMARLTYRSSPVGVVLVVPGGPRAAVRREADSVAVVGDPVELALHAFGRTEAADVEVLGRPETVSRFLSGR
ncbi:TIGR03085 family metal-binding protein [Georgenia sp. 10Sc9-8]|uniref:TIGR03085 family metal-binding protein n=1 Tax=Georgenia halotolerans TaxID=3028317 RepID=A0ABT5U2X2_9MICO|nr:TIGR03085 family metal-binding protein [Georgenia halotolerans]